MPAYVTPPLPERLEPVVEILGINQVRLAVLLALRGGPRTVPELAEELGVQRVTLNRHLRDLERHEMVEASREPGPDRRGGDAIFWQLRTMRVVGELDALTQYFA